MKTREQIEELKADWSKDPCWDIESTAGFEDHEDELLEYRLSYEKECQKRYDAKVEEVMVKYNCNYQVAEFIVSTKEEFQSLKREIDDLKDCLCKIE